MSQTKLCRLCVKVCTDYASLYNETGQKNNIYDRTLKYFDPMFLITNHVAGPAVLCLECCGHISVFYNFQQAVFQAQRRLREGEKEIEFEFEKKMSEELILNNMNNSQVNVKQDDSISLPDLELVEEFMFTDSVPNEDNRLNSQTVIEPIPQCENTVEDTEQSKDQPLSTYDTSEKGSDSDGNQPATTIKRKLRRSQRSAPKDLDTVIAQRKQSLECVICKESLANFKSLSEHFRHEHPNEPIPMCDNTEEFGDKDDKIIIIINNSDSEQSEDHPLTISDNSESEKGNDSDDNQPTTTLKRKHEQKQNTDDLIPTCENIEKFGDKDDTVWKPSLECVICKKSLANFKSLSEHFRLKHPNEPIPTCENREELGDGNDKIIINNFDTEQSKDQPISTSCTSESEKGSDSDYIHPRTTMKRKRKRRQRSAAKDLDAVIAQWKPSLECVVCKKSVANFLSLSLHFRNEHPNERCRVECCSCRFYGRSIVAEHARLHFNPDKVKCKLCDSYFSSINCMHVHMRRVHFTANIETSDTTGNSKLRSKSMQRKRKQNADQPIPTCANTEEFGDKNDNNFDTEQSKDRPISTSDTSQKGSDLDDNQPTTTIKRKRKKRSAGKDLDAVIAQWKPSLECVVCKKSVANFLSLSLHFRNEHPNERCRVECCSRRIYSRCRLVVHARLHLNPNKIKCKLCDSYFAALNWLQFHMRVVHFNTNIEISDKIGNSKLRSKSSIECVICKTSFAEFSLLKLHYRQYHPTEVCYVLCCERKFYYPYLVEEHMRLHRDPNAFKCEICGKRLSCSPVLKTHMRQCHSNIETADP